MIEERATSGQSVGAGGGQGRKGPGRLYRWARWFVAAALGRDRGTELPQLAVLIRFSLISLSGTAIDFLILWALVALGGLDVLPAKVLASEGAILSNFVWNERWTFAGRSTKQGVLRRLIAFNGASLGSLLVSLAVVALGVALWGRQAYLAANALALPASFACTYIAANWVIWGNRRRGEDAPDGAANTAPR